MMSLLLPKLVYVLIVGLALFAPYAAFRGKAASGDALPLGPVVGVALLAGGVVLIAAQPGNLNFASLLLLIPAIGRGRAAFGGCIAAALLLAPVQWWSFPSDLAPAQTIVFLLLGLAAVALIRWPWGRDMPRLPLAATVALSFIVGIGAGLLTTPFEAFDTAYTAWHHWGAFLSPVEAWLAGGVPYRDFPIQYGLGPTTLLAATCGADCWRGMYWTVVVANALYFAVLAGGTALLTARLPHSLRWLSMAAMFIAAFVWTGFPPVFAGPVITPSVAGLRFLSIAALLFHIIHAESRGRRRDWIGHAIWLVDLFWSPECAFFGTLIWWPYLALRDACEQASGRAALLALGRGALRGGIALSIGVGAFAALLWLLTGGTMTPVDFFAYVQHPPEQLPVNPIGTIWIPLAVIALTLQFLTGLRPSAETRILYACLLGLLASGAYYLSRSHDNNVLNLFPLLLLVLLALLAIIHGKDDVRLTFARHFVQTMLVGMIAFTATFNFDMWATGIAKVGPFHIGPDRLLARFAPERADPDPLVNREAAAALDALRREGVVSVVVLDTSRIIPRAPAGTGWTGVNNAANYEPLPDAMIARYIRRGAVAYARPGWILVGRTRVAHWLPLFRSAYDVRETRRYGRYTAYRLSPRRP